MLNDIPVKDFPRTTAIDASNEAPNTASFRCLLDCNAQVHVADPDFKSNITNRGLLLFADGCLLPALADHRSTWLDALNDVAQTGEGQFFALTMHPKLESVGIVPHRHSGLISIRLPLPRLCSPESVIAYARLVRLTPRETSVLDLITQGLTPTAVAATLQTRESTVRTQIKSILAKSNHHSMRGLLVTLACLPSISKAASLPLNALESAPQRPPLAAADPRDAARNSAC